MRILWHGPGPYWPTGYGRMCALFAPRLAALGHQVVISEMEKHPDSPGGWAGLPIVGPSSIRYTVPVEQVRAAFGGHDPDLVLVGKGDPWVLPAAQLRRWRTIVWTCVDCEPLAHGDLQFFKASGARPVAVSRFGERVLAAAGLDPAYIPYGIELGQYGPHPEGQAAARAQLGLPPDVFIAGINAANIGIRKGWAEGLAAWAEFHGKLCPSALLLAHTVPDHPEGIGLRALCDQLGVTGSVLFGSHARMDHSQMLAWYRCLDVLVLPTYGEGFGLPIVEALACGVPVIATDCSAVTELVPRKAGWLVQSQQFWNPDHRAWWRIPRIGEITALLCHAEARPPAVPPDVVASYDADRVTAEHWKPFLDSIGVAGG